MLNKQSDKQSVRVSNYPTSLDIAQIMEILPHRFPMLLVDRVLEITENTIKAVKNVTVNEPFFQGHFPNMPIMPGVLIIEALAQTAGIFAIVHVAAEVHEAQVFFMTIDKVKFRKPVRPGDQLILTTEVIQWRKKVVKVAGKAYVDNELVCEAELMAAY